MGSEEWSSGYGKSGHPWLPPGFRFHPTDEELVTCYLAKKVEDDSFTDPAIAEVDINKCEPWELPAKAKMGEKEWYFYTLLDRKYPTGMRTNRATNAGYWKATGKDREVLSSVNNNLVGMKKTLVFYKGRAPKGEKTNWVMHEYRLEGATLNIIPRTSKEERVVCRVFKKSMAETKVCFYEDYASSSSSSLPPLLDSPHHHHFSEGVVYNPSDFFSTKASYNNSHLQSINPHLDEALPWMKILMDDYNEEDDQHDQVNHSSAQNKLKRKLSDSGLLFEDMLHEHLQEHQFKQHQRQNAYNDDITGLGQQLLEEEADIINPISNSNYISNSILTRCTSHIDLDKLWVEY